MYTNGANSISDFVRGVSIFAKTISGVAYPSRKICDRKIDRLPNLADQNPTADNLNTPNEKS